MALLDNWKAAHALFHFRALSVGDSSATSGCVIVSMALIPAFIVLPRVQDSMPTPDNGTVGVLIPWKGSDMVLELWGG